MEVFIRDLPPDPVKSAILMDEREEEREKGKDREMGYRKNVRRTIAGCVRRMCLAIINISIQRFIQ